MPPQQMFPLPQPEVIEVPVPVGPEALEVHHDHIVQVPVEVAVPIAVRLPPERHVYRTMTKKRVSQSPPPPMVLHMQHVSDYIPAEPVHSVVVEVPVQVPVPVDRLVEVELPVEVQVPVEVPVEVQVPVIVEVPVEKIVEVEKIVHVQVPVEVEKIVHVPVYQQQPQPQMMHPQPQPQPQMMHPQPQPQMIHPPPRSISPPRQMRVPEYRSVSPQRLMRSISPGGMRGRAGPLVHERLQEGYGRSATLASPPVTARSSIYAPSMPPAMGVSSTYGNRYVESAQAQQFNGLQNPAAAASNARQASLSPRYMYNPAAPHAVSGVLGAGYSSGAAGYKYDPAAGYRTTTSISSDREKSLSPTKASRMDYGRVQDRIHF